MYNGKIRFLAIALIIAAVLPVLYIGAVVDSQLSLAGSSERFLSDFAVTEGGVVSADDDGNVVFNIKEAAHNLKFKCTGAYAEGEQNAICLWMNNRTGSTKIYVDVEFMDADGKIDSVSYIKDVENSGSDAYLFVPSGKNDFVASISIKAAGVSEGSISVMGIWHCYYWFSDNVIHKNVGNISTFEYKNGGAGVLIEGTVLYDIIIASEESTINIYRLKPGEVLSDEFIKENPPVAGSAISRSFSFRIPNKEDIDFASSYAVTINNPDGSIRYILEDKRYPDTDSEDVETYGFKGAATSLEYMPTEMAVSSLIIDINMSDIINDIPGGYLYSFGGVNYFFKNTVVDRIHRRITSHTADSGTVYLRLLGSDDEAIYDNISYEVTDENAAKLYATVSFLAETYKESVSGFIVGSRFDTPYLYSNVNGVPYGEYIGKYADYLSVLRSAIKNTDPAMKVILPVSSNNVFFEDSRPGSDMYPMFAMLISLFEAYSSENRGSITLMLEDETFPYVTELLSDNEAGIEAHSVDKKEIMRLTCENVRLFERFIDYLSDRYGLTEDKYFYSWQPYGFHEKSDLCLAYIYNYLHLSTRERLYSFFCDFSADESIGDFRKSEDMLEAIRIMGSDTGKSYAGGKLFEVSGLSFEGIEGYDNYKAIGFSGEELPVLDSLPASIKGSADMIDLSSISGVAGWKNGVYSETVSIASVGDYGRAVRTLMSLPAYRSEYADIIYDFKRNLDIREVTSLGLKLIINTQNTEEKKEKYTLKVALGSSESKGVCEYSRDISSGELIDIIIDTSSFEGMRNISYMKISVQNNSGREDELFLHICEVKAYSSILENESLKTLFEAPPEISGDSTEEGANADDNVFMLLICFFAFAAISIAAVITVNRTGENKSSEIR